MLSAVLVIVSLVLIALLVYDWRLRHTDAYRAARLYPGGILYPVLGNIMEILFKDPVQAFVYARTCAEKYGHSYRQWIFGDVILNIVRVKEAELILSSNKHTRKSVIYRFLGPLMGDGLLCSRGSKWRTRRRILTPAFHFNILSNFLLVFQEEADRLVRFLEKYAIAKKEVELQQTITRFTLNTICETAMGVKLDTYKEADQYRSKVYEVGEMLVHRTMNPCLYDDGVYNLMGHLKPLEDAVEPIHAFTRSIIRQRRERMKKVFQGVVAEENIYVGMKDRSAMLDTLLLAESNNTIDEDGIREEVDTFIFEGHDTTAAGIIFALLLLATEQDAQEEAYNELTKARKEKPENQAFTMTDYNNLKYLDRFVKESLRLYPPVAFISRSLSGTLNVDSAKFPHGTITNIHIYDLNGIRYSFQIRKNSTRIAFCRKLLPNAIHTRMFLSVQGQETASDRSTHCWR